MYSSESLCRALVSTGVEIRVLTTDSAGPRLRDRLTASPERDLISNELHVEYCRRIAGRSISVDLLAKLVPLVKWSDVVHLTAVYSFPILPALLASRVFGKPIVWSPRGAFLRWAKTSKPALKGLWDLACRAFVRNSCAAIHATSLAELEACGRRMPGIETVLIPNGIDVPETLPERTWKPSNVLRLLYVGRLDPIKGIENLLRALPLIARGQSQLSLYGTGEPGYTCTLQSLARSLGLASRVTFFGHADDATKRQAFAQADVCIMPSHSENFGLVVAESLAHGVPVIASTGTPWKEIEVQGCGLWVDNDAHSLARAVDAIRDRALDSMGTLGRAWMRRDFSWTVIGNRMYALYDRLTREREIAT
jgi:glycosyltransferase involved in cell wall biosynthesis